MSCSQLAPNAPQRPFSTSLALARSLSTRPYVGTGPGAGVGVGIEVRAGPAIKRSVVSPGVGSGKKKAVTRIVVVAGSGEGLAG